MTNFLTSILRTLAQVLVGYLITWFAARGLDVPDQVRDWALTAIVAGGILIWTALIRWLETRKGAGAVATACRRLAAILMLGLARPVYVPSGTQVQAVSDTAGTRSVEVAADTWTVSGHGPVPRMALPADADLARLRRSADGHGLTDS